jgi:hypothetical protein
MYISALLKRTLKLEVLMDLYFEGEKSFKVHLHYGEICIELVGWKEEKVFCIFSADFAVV